MGDSLARQCHVCADASGLPHFQSAELPHPSRRPGTTRVDAGGRVTHGQADIGSQLSGTSARAHNLLCHNSLRSRILSMCPNWWGEPLIFPIWPTGDPRLLARLSQTRFDRYLPLNYAECRIETSFCEAA